MTHPDDIILDEVTMDEHEFNEYMHNLELRSLNEALERLDPRNPAPVTLTGVQITYIRRAIQTQLVRLKLEEKK